MTTMSMPDAPLFLYQYSLFLVPVPVFNARFAWLSEEVLHVVPCRILKHSPSSPTTGCKLPTATFPPDPSSISSRSRRPTQQAMPHSEIYATTPTPLPEGYIRRRRLSSTSGRRAIVVVDPLSSGALLAQVRADSVSFTSFYSLLRGVLPLSLYVMTGCVETS